LKLSKWKGLDEVDGVISASILARYSASARVGLGGRGERDKGGGVGGGLGDVDLDLDDIDAGLGSSTKGAGWIQISGGWALLC
jgi:hypothetical protein